MVIKSSSAREVDRLVAQLRDGSSVQREAAVARLRIIGARAVERLAQLVRSGPDAARAAALKALEGIDDPRSRELALQSLSSETSTVAAAAVTALRPWLPDVSVLDMVTSVALDKTRSASVRLAALDALSELPRATIQPVIQQVGGDDPSLAARAVGQPASQTFEQPVAFKEWLALRGTAAALSEIHDAIARIRAREHDEPSARRRQEWAVARAAAHHVLAQRGSRVALYDLRETFDSAQAAVPLDFLNAIALIGDASCLEPLARAWLAAGRELWWRDRIADAARAIVVREKLTARHSLVKRVRSKFPGLL